ncbi:pyridoxamine 5'-phosphate oxidase family protein [Pseudonocardia acaciae]|uniref:pyridoxamine 5'-phosphate oxidase family protein n=1 Tax=Pseudonocardia acaciae TaxID=551276 RepID=UPI0004916A55|nr:pyridoxamine 5'-phosphate oxidase family protein [Pseudonocardia acaciae]
MVSWADVQASAPEFAAGVRAIFDKGKHKTIATLRADGAPRISGIEAEFAGGELTFGSMPGARKGADLVRDPRLALHSPSVDPPEDAPSSWQGDAKIAGRAVYTRELTGETPGQEFRVDIEEVVRIRVGEPADHLVIEVWRPDSGLRRITRT